MAKRPTPDRAARHSQTPIIRAQVISLRRMALEANTQADAIDPSSNSHIGEVLASIMAAAFALELSLKLFYMTFHEAPPKNTHDLTNLWFGLPEKWRNETSREYENDARSRSNFRAIAFQRAPDAPQVPQEHNTGGVATANGLLAAVADAFQYSRYFYENIEAGRWAHIDYPIHQMVAMIDVLTAFYAHLLDEGAARVGSET